MTSQTLDARSSVRRPDGSGEADFGPAPMMSATGTHSGAFTGNGFQYPPLMQDHIHTKDEEDPSQILDNVNKYSHVMKPKDELMPGVPSIPGQQIPFSVGSSPNDTSASQVPAQGLPSIRKQVPPAPSSGHVGSAPQPPNFKPPFVIDLAMVRRTMEGVNRVLGVDLGGTEVGESALHDNFSVSEGENAKDNSGVAKAELSHVRLISDACGYIVANVARAVYDAARESAEENAQRGKPDAPPVPPVRKKRGGILGFKELAARANLSPWHFHRVFRFVTGVTPKAYGEALWEYLMIEAGFDLEDEDLTIDRMLVNGPSAPVLSGNAITTSSSSSSSSPRSPTSVPSLSPASDVSAKTPHTQVQAQNLSAPAPSQPTGRQTVQPLAGPIGNGRVRKTGSRSRTARSRSRTGSQSQNHVLSGLASLESGQPDASQVTRGRSFSRVKTPVHQGFHTAPGFPRDHSAPRMPSTMNGQGSLSLGGPTLSPNYIGPNSSGPHQHIGGVASDGFVPADDFISQLAQEDDFLATPEVPNTLDLPDMTSLSLQQIEPASPVVGQPLNNDHKALSASAPDMSLLHSFYNGDNNGVQAQQRFRNQDQAQTSSHQRTLSTSQLTAGDRTMHHSNFGHSPTDYQLPGRQAFPPPNAASNIPGQGLGVSYYDNNAIPDPVQGVPGSGSIHENLRENLQREMYHQQDRIDDPSIDQLEDLPTSFYLESDSKHLGGGSGLDGEDEFVSALISEEDPPLLPAWNEAEEGTLSFGF